MNKKSEKKLFHYSNPKCHSNIFIILQCCCWPSELAMEYPYLQVKVNNKKNAGSEII